MFLLRWLLLKWVQGVDKEPIIEHSPEIFRISDISDSVGSDGGGSGLEDDVELIHGVRDFVKDSSDS